MDAGLSPAQQNPREDGVFHDEETWAVEARVP